MTDYQCCRSIGANDKTGGFPCEVAAAPQPCPKISDSRSVPKLGASISEPRGSTILRLFNSSVQFRVLRRGWGCEDMARIHQNSPCSSGEWREQINICMIMYIYIYIWLYSPSIGRSHLHILPIYKWEKPEHYRKLTGWGHYPPAPLAIGMILQVWTVAPTLEWLQSRRFPVARCSQCVDDSCFFFFVVKPCMIMYDLQCTRHLHGESMTSFVDGSLEKDMNMSTCLNVELNVWDNKWDRQRSTKINQVYHGMKAWYHH